MMDSANDAGNPGLVVVETPAGASPESPFLTIEIEGPLLERMRIFHAASREWKDQSLEAFGAWLVRRGLSTEINDKCFIECLRPGGRECA